MTTNIKKTFQYVAMLTVTVLLLWISFDSIAVSGDKNKLDFLLNIWHSANKPFLFISAFIAILSHFFRAKRWKLLLNPLGYQASTGHSFLSVMVGYFINLAIPRGGEVSRCYNLYRLNKTPVDISLGTVVAERVIDLLFLIILLGISFLIEIENLVLFFNSEEVQALRSGDSETNTYNYIAIGMLMLFLSIVVIFQYLIRKRKYMLLKLLSKGRGILRGIRSGASSVLKLQKRSLFVFYSLLIWICYYLMMYFVMLAFPETAHLGLQAALTLFVIGGIAMAMPLPGGAGSFHVLVSTGLIMLYHLGQDKSVAFTFIFHAWQTMVVIIVGALSLLLSQLLKRKIDSNKG